MPCLLSRGQDNYTWSEKDTCELWLNEWWVKLIHLTSATVQEHDIHNVISYVPLAFNLHNTNTQLSLQGTQSMIHKPSYVIEITSHIFMHQI
jgi:hypothetical protein